MLLGHLRPGVEQGISSLLARFLEPFFLDRSLVSQDDAIQQLPVVKDILDVLLGLLEDDIGSKES